MSVWAPLDVHMFRRRANFRADVRGCAVEKEQAWTRVGEELEKLKHGEHFIRGSG